MPWIVIGLVGLFGYFALKDSGAGASGDAPSRPVAPPWTSLPDTAARSELVLAAQALLTNYQALACAGLDAGRVERFQRAVNAYAASMGKNRQLNEDGLYDVATDAAIGMVFGLRLSGCVPAYDGAGAGGGVYSMPSGGNTEGGLGAFFVAPTYAQPSAPTYAQPSAPTYAATNAPGTPTYTPPLPPGTPQTATQTTAPAKQQQANSPPASGGTGVPVSGFGSPIEAGRTSERFRYT